MPRSPTRPMLATRYVLRSDFTCACELAVPEGAGVLLVTLSAAVGDAPAPRCPNRAPDVRAVQEALNHFAPADGGPSPALVVDGVCGAPTRRAIRAFQRRWATCGLAGGTERDGVIDVDGPTVARLREGPPAGPTSVGAGDGAAAHAQARGVRPRVLELLASARAVLSVAGARYKRVLLPDDAANLARADAAVAKVERHFHAGRTRDPAARLARVDGVFHLMQAALALTADGVVADAAPPADDPHALAAAWAGGFHTGAAPCGGAATAASPHGAAAGRMDAIRLYPAARGLGRDALAYALVHALAHHVAPASAPIVDLAAWHRAPDAYAALGPAGALRNADSYAQFAFDAAGAGGFDPRRGGRSGRHDGRHAEDDDGGVGSEEGDEVGGVAAAVGL